MKRIAITITTGILGMAIAGCASHRASDNTAILHADSGSALLSFDADSYERIFELTRERLIDYRFAIDRVDARRGVITTQPKRTNGLASPWDREQSSLGQEWEDLINEQRRVVRVEFDREATEPSMRITVEVLRTHRPNWRVESESIRLSTHARSRDALGHAEPTSYLERIGLDEQFALRIAESIEQDQGQ